MTSHECIRCEGETGYGYPVEVYGRKIFVPLCEDCKDMPEELIKTTAIVRYFREKYPDNYKQKVSEFFGKVLVNTW